MGAYTCERLTVIVGRDRLIDSEANRREPRRDSAEYQCPTV
jgi:hypothetical protein